MAVIVNPVNGQSASAFDAGDVSGMLVRFANQTIAGADIPVQYPEFERTVEEYGSILADVRIPAPQGYEPNPDTTDICGPYYFNVDASYSQPWKQAQYAMEFRRVDLTKAVGDQAAFNDLLSRIMNATREGYQAEVNQAMEDAILLGTHDVDSMPTALLNYDGEDSSLASAIANATKGWLNTTSRVHVLNNPTWDDIVTEVRNVVDDMLRANSKYLGKTEDGVTSKAGVNGYGARIEDLVVLMPYWLYNRMDTAYLQTLIRLQSVEAFPPIIKYGGRMSVDTSTGTIFGYPIIIMDRRVLLHVVRHMEYVSEDVRCRWSTVYQLNVEHGIKYCPWYKAYAIVTPMPTANNAGQLNVADIQSNVSTINTNVGGIGANVRNIATYTSAIRTAVAADNPGAYSNMQVNMENTTNNAQTMKNDISALRTGVVREDPSSYADIQSTIVNQGTSLRAIADNVGDIRTGTVDANPSGKATIQTSVATGTQAAAASAEPAAEQPASAEPTAAPTTEATPDTKATSTKTSK